MAKKARKARTTRTAKEAQPRKAARKRAANANGTSRSADATVLLKADHRAVEALFEKFEKARGADAKQRIANEICLELMVHAQIEEEIFYPGVKAAIEGEVYAEAHVEHDGAKVLIAEILDGGPGDEFYEANVKVLSETVKHHVREEEKRDGMFAQAKQSGVDLAALAERLETRKQDLMRIFRRNGLPRPVTRTLKGPKLRLGQPTAAA